MVSLRFAELALRGAVCAETGLTSGRDGTGRDDCRQATPDTIHRAPVPPRLLSLVCRCAALRSTRAFAHLTVVIPLPPLSLSIPSSLRKDHKVGRIGCAVLCTRAPRAVRASRRIASVRFEFGRVRLSQPAGRAVRSRLGRLARHTGGRSRASGQNWSESAASGERRSDAMVQLRASLEAVVLQAWRDRWTELEWSINLKAALSEDASELNKLCGARRTRFFAKCFSKRPFSGLLLRQATLSEVPNKLMFNYLSYTVAAQVCSQRLLYSAT